MYRGSGAIDFVPTLLKRAHDTVLCVARDMKMRAGEYLARLLSREIGLRRRQKCSRSTLDAWRAEGMERAHECQPQPSRGACSTVITAPRLNVQLPRQAFLARLLVNQ